MALAWVTTENGIFNSAPHRGLPDGQCRLWVQTTRGERAELFSVLSSFGGVPEWFLFKAIETNVLRESSTSEFSHSLQTV